MRQDESQTLSLCPVCLQVIPAKRTSQNGDLYLEKECSQHGHFKTLIWRDAESYTSWGMTSVKAVPPQRFKTAFDQGCPYDCGLCSDHQAQTCTAIIEVTQRCNLECPVCFASSPMKGKSDPGLEQIEKMFQSVREYAGNPSLQLSGGEPTVRDDLPEIIALGKTMGFSHIQVNSNGLRIARHPDYLRKLVEAGADLIYLQFDGVDDEVYRALRGRALFDIKVQAIQNCAAANIGVLLVPTVFPQHNLHQLGDIVQFAKSWIPFVKGIHFQPVSYFGRFPGIQGDEEDRVTLPDVIHALVEQSGGELKKDNFLPRRSEDAHCSFNSVFVLGEDGKLHGRTNINYLAISEHQTDEQPPALLAQAFVNQRWRYIDEPQSEENSCCCCSQKSSYEKRLEREQKYSITLTGMPFQDVWNIDFDRLQKCCVHVVTEQGHLVPFCAYYLTSLSGERIY
jgi:uncharacterized radical SAM superfamily Fe-S cluster-containing enzyme